MEAFHPVIYLFGAVLLYAAVKMMRGGQHVRPEDNRVLRALRRILPATEDLHGQRFVVRKGGGVLATPLLVALIVVEVTDLIFAVDSIPAILAVTTDTFVVYTSNVFALLGMRALYFPAGRGGGPVSLPAARAGDHPGRGRGQAADRRPLRGPGLGLARLHRRRPGRRRHPVHP